MMLFFAFACVLCYLLWGDYLIHNSFEEFQILISSDIKLNISINSEEFQILWSPLRRYSSCHFSSICCTCKFLHCPCNMMFQFLHSEVWPLHGLMCGTPSWVSSSGCHFRLRFFSAWHSYCLRLRLTWFFGSFTNIHTSTCKTWHISFKCANLFTLDSLHEEIPESWGHHLF